MRMSVERLKKRHETSMGILNEITLNYPSIEKPNHPPEDAEDVTLLLADTVAAMLVSLVSSAAQLPPSIRNVFREALTEAFIGCLRARVKRMIELEAEKARK